MTGRRNFTNVFAEGSLMFDRVWFNVVGGSYETVGGRLFGYLRKRVKSVAYPGLIPGTEDDRVDGRIYKNVSDADNRKLNKFEGDYYEKKCEACELEDGSRLTVCVYLFKESHKGLLEDAE